MDVARLHSWDLDYASAAKLQTSLRGRIIRRSSGRNWNLVAGCDVSYSRGSDVFYGGVVVLSLPDMALVDQARVVNRSSFPYIPGLLSFREAPILLEAFARLRTVPDLVLVDGQGYAHPRRMGLAAHLGLFLDVPTVGCAKSRLVGEYVEPELAAGSRSPLVDGSERIGTVLRTRTGVKPVFVSTGNRIDLRGAERAVLKCCSRYRLPEPIRTAHRLVNEIRRQREDGLNRGA